MNCEILRTLYVKANGEILCNDDQGEQVSLALLDIASKSPRLTDVFANEKYQHMRAAFAAGQVPWPSICENCALLRPDEPFGADLIAQGVIQKIQLETSLACALKCPSCSNMAQLRNRPGSVHMPIALVTQMLTELTQEGFRIETIEFCGQGEPLNHPRFHDLLAEVIRLCPDTRLRLVTNGNHDHGAKIGRQLIHETIVSIDGVHQQSYAQYRVNGRVERALAFLRDAVALKQEIGGSVIWKYILFTSNDSDAEILEAQRVAHEIGVDRLWFVHGHGPMRSQTFTFENARTFPIAYPRVKLESHPSYNRKAKVWNNLGPGTCLGGAPGTVWLDNFVLHGNGTASLSGWINAAAPHFDQVRLALNDGEWTGIACDIHRHDVTDANPLFANPVCGFDVTIAVSGNITEPLSLCFSLTEGESEVSLMELTIPTLAPKAVAVGAGEGI